MLAPLMVAQTALTGSQSSQTTALASAALQAFIQNAQAHRGKKLTIAQADRLIADATRIRAVLGATR